MEKQNRKVDDFFRQALEQHTVIPSDAARAAFLKDAASITRAVKPTRKVYLIISGIFFLAMMITGLLTGQPGFSVKEQKQSLGKSTDNINTAIIIPEKKNKTHETILPLIASIQKTRAQTKDMPSNSTFTNNLSIIHGEGITANPIQQDINLESVTNKTTPEIIPVIATTTESLADKTEKQVLESQVTATPDIKAPQEEKKNSRKESSPEINRIWNIDLGAYYSPEWMFNTLEGEKYANNYGIEGTFHFGKYSIRTGAGLSVTKGTNELSINYNDFIGNINHLDSIVFMWDATHTHLIPTYYFTTTSVWDSLLRTQHTHLIKRYTYLQIPFILGYDFIRTDHFSLGLRAGPVFSFLLKTEQISDNYEAGKDRIIQINQITPDRIQTNWQFTGGINAGFGFTRRLWLEIEPDVRYYFNSVYEKPGNNTKPWSAGFRVALMFRE